MSDQALSDVRVIELADAHGEWCGKLLSDMGADVIKVEPPAGSPSRAVGPFVEDGPHPERSLSFWHANTGKRSVVLDLDAERDREALRRLVLGADVFLETLAPGAAAALGLGYETLAAANPRLVHVAVTPFGQSGPYVDKQWQTTDLVSMALGGPMQACGYDAEEGDGIPPVRPGAGHSFYTASHYAAVATLVALLEREESGRGQYIDMSAQAALAVTVEFSSLYWEYQGAVLRRQTGRHAGLGQTARTQYRCVDGRYINLAIPLNPKGWDTLIGYLREQGLGEDLDDDVHADPRHRLDRGGAVFHALEVLTAHHTAEELWHIGQQLGLTWGAVRAPEEWLDDPHARAREFFVEVEHPELGRTVTYPGAPYRFGATPWRIGRRPPLLGEHTAEVLAALEDEG